ncbi:hypothetical protein KW789_02910 [Candidatus Saccharibacteria bacterium]|nr:hypothetical protein [Candidatus Saccharibacteria bacterium]
MTGVQAMKQMWVDLAEDGRDDHEKKMAIRQLTATSSWPEIQGSLTRSGRKVVDTEAWAPSITTSPEDYPRVLRSRVDAAPHIVDGAMEAAEKAGYARTDQSYEARNFRSAERIDYAIEKQMSNEDFQTQSDGFWDEVARVAKQTDENGRPTEQALRIRTHLRERFQAIQDAGPTARQSMLGHLAAGGSLQKNVDDVLGDGLSVSNFIHGEVDAVEQPPAQPGEEPTRTYAVNPGREQQQRRAAAAQQPAAQAQPQAQAPDGELRIDRGPATGWNAGPEYPPEPIEPPDPNPNPPTNPPNNPTQ